MNTRTRTLLVVLLLVAMIWSSSHTLAAEPIRVGYLGPLTGIYAQVGIDGLKQNVVIREYPMVSQFWTYKPEEFLKAPPYDRNYPPLKP